MVRSLIRFNAIDITDNRLLDDYIVITEYEFYKAFHADDFKWQQVREAVLKSFASTSRLILPITNIC